MFGCFRRLGCLVFLLIVAVIAWFNRDRLEAIYRRYAGDHAPSDSAAVTSVASGGWEALTSDKAARGQTAVQSLSTPRGPAFVNLTAGEASQRATSLRCSDQRRLLPTTPPSLRFAPITMP